MSRTLRLLLVLLMRSVRSRRDLLPENLALRQQLAVLRQMHPQLFNREVMEAMKAIGIKSVSTSFKSPWQNAIAERFVGSCRRDLLDHVIVLNERHLKRLLAEYVRYYQEERTHLGLDKRTPAGRKAATDTTSRAKVISMPQLGGLHHRYDLAA